MSGYKWFVEYEILNMDKAGATLFPQYGQGTGSLSVSEITEMVDQIVKKTNDELDNELDWVYPDEILITGITRIYEL